MKINVILGSTRPGRIGERVAKWVVSVAKDQADFEVKLVDLADFNLEHLNEAISPRFNPNRKPEGDVARWLDTMAQADGYVIVTPEYNHSIPGVLKDALDYLDYQMVKKPVAIVSYGSVGGARAAEHLKDIVIESKAAVVPEAIALMSPTDNLSEDGTFVGDKQIVNVLTELSWWTKTLKNGRQ
jgi:NAD(P)H-dependent FMN reductase